MKPLIFCIIGESGAGKTMIAEYLEELAGIQLINSWTDRPKRHEDEEGHTFVDKGFFDLLKKKDMIAYTEWNGYRYCCLKSDVKDVNTYVIDERGIQYLKEHFSHLYDIVSIRIHRPLWLREKFADEERLKRDEGKFILPDSYYDIIINNISEVKFNLLFAVWEEVRKYL